MENNKPRVSVLMAVYKGEKYLKEAIDSILNQTYRDYEFIIINDGSTDNCADIVKSYRDKRIKFIDNGGNIGLAATLNKGIDLASGEYIVRMDSDDISMPERIEKQVNFMDKHLDVGISGTWIKYIGIPNFLWRSTVYKYPISHRVIRAKSMFVSSLCHPSVIMRKSLIEKFKLRYDCDHRDAEDFTFWQKSCHYFTLTNMPEVLLLYRVSPGSITQSNTADGFQTARRIIRENIQNLGIDTSVEEILIFRNKLIKFTIKSLINFHSWLQKLQKANLKKQLYPEPEFSQALSDEWFFACYRSARLGIKAWSLFWQFPLSRISKFDLEERVKFLLRCLWSTLNSKIEFKNKKKNNKSLSDSSSNSKVLFCPEFKNPGGTRTYCKNMMEFYHRNKISAMIMIRRDQLDDEIMSLILKYNFCYKILPLKKQPFFNNLKFLSYFTIRMEEILRIFYILIFYLLYKPNFIHISDYSISIALGTFWLPVKSIYIIHCPFTEKLKRPFPNFYKKSLLSRKINILAVSKYAKKEILCNWFRENSDNYISVVYNHAGSVNESTQGLLEKKSNRLCILTLGSLTVFKNPDYWIKVAERVINDIKTYDIDFVWAGDGDLLDKCRAKVQSMGNSRIKFIGYQGDIASLYLSADIYFQPSTYESQSIATIEAMKYGLPCIVSNCGGLVENVIDGESGFVFALDDFDSVITKFNLLIHDNKLRNTMGQKAKRRYKDIFSYEIFEKRMKKFFENN